MVPSFLVIGAAKCGTTSLCSLLGEHPEVFVTEPKEPHYFSRITTFEARRAWYESLFSGATGFRAAGEGSTSYSHPHRIHLVVPRLAAAVPDCRLIYMVRHPVRRLESDWIMRCLEGRAREPIGQAVDVHASLLTIGLYWQHLSLYRRFFTDEQILVVFLEDLVRDAAGTLRRVFRHIGVDEGFLPSDPEKPRNTAADRALATRVTYLEERVPGLRRIKALLPVRVVTLGRSLLSRGIQEPPRPRWDGPALSAVASLLREDSRELLAYCGKHPGFWRLDEQPA